MKVVQVNFPVRVQFGRVQVTGQHEVEFAVFGLDKADTESAPFVFCRLCPDAAETSRAGFAKIDCKVYGNGNQSEETHPL